VTCYGRVARSSSFGGFGGAESVAVGAGFDDVGVEGESVDDRGDEAGV